MKSILCTLLTAWSCLMANAVNIVEIPLWEGYAVCDNWTNQPYLLSDGGAELQGAGAMAGQELRFYITPTDSKWNFEVYEGHWGVRYGTFSSASYGDGNAVDLEANGGYVSIFVTDEMLAKAAVRYNWGGTFVGNGDNTVLTRITLVVEEGGETLAPLMLNELMQSNIDATMDDLNEFPDSWVELYNPNATAVNLGLYSLGLTPRADEAWQLPSAVIGANQCLLVYCDKEARGRHTDFRLESGKGGSVYLFRLGDIADSLVNLRKQPAPNVAYGRQTDGASLWGYQAEPTPGAANCGQVCDHVLGEPVFSVPGRVITGGGSVTLRITMPDDTPEGTVLRYTTNGTEPVATSPVFPANGMQFSATRIMRVKPFCEGYLSPRSVTQSYIFLPRSMTLPVVSIVTDRKYFFDPKQGIYVDGSYGGGKNNYEYNWRRPINLELFTAAGEDSQLNQLCETRVSGGASRGTSLRSLALYAHKRFGQKRFAYEFFPEQRPEETDFKSLVLRNAGNDFDYLYMRDAVIQGTMARHVDLDYQAYMPTIFYLNGEYKGMLNVRERANEDNVYTNYDGLEDIDLLENGQLKAGTWDSYNAFKDFYAEHGHTWDEYAERMDLIEYINLMIMNLYYCNLDFPGNNFVMWRPAEEGGRWRFISKDTDFGLGLYGRPVSYNTIEWLYNNSYDPGNNWANQPDHTRLFRRLMEDETFAREFQDRCAIYMGDFMNYDGTWVVWGPMYEAIRTEYPVHRKLYNEWWPNYGDELRNAQQWLRGRTNQFYDMVARYYKLGTPRTLVINSSLTEAELADAAVEMNGVALSAHKFDGKFYQGRTVTLQGRANASGRGIIGWTIRRISPTGQVSTEVIDGSTCQFTMPECMRCQVDAVVGDVQSIDAVLADDTAVPTAIYDIHGIRHDHLVCGENIVVMSNGETRKVFF